MLSQLLASLKKFIKREEGVTAIEYSLIAALIAVAIIVAVGNVGEDVDTTFDSVVTALPGGNA